MFTGNIQDKVKSTFWMEEIKMEVFIGNYCCNFLITGTFEIQGLNCHFGEF